MGWVRKERKNSKGWRKHIRRQKATTKKLSAREATIHAKEAIGQKKREERNRENERIEKRRQWRESEEKRERERAEQAARRRMSTWYDW